MIPFFEKTWFFWWAIATVVILRWLHVISCNNSQETLEAPDPAGDDTPSDVDAIPAQKHDPPGLGRRHAY